MSDEALLDSASSSETSSDVGSTQDSQPTQDSGSQSASAPSQDVWSSFRSLPDFQGQDDRAIAGRLYASLEREKAATKALQQYQQLIPYAQEYLSYRPQFEKWREERERGPQQVAPQQPQQEQKQAGWWNPPQVRESYKQYLIKDENGREVISPDAPLDARHALYEYQKYKADFAQKFLADPQQALGPMVEQIAAERARDIVEQQLQQASDAGFVSSLEQSNKDWLYEADGQTPTREGLMVQKYIDVAARSGLRTPQERWQFACDMVERDLLREVMETKASQQARSQFEGAMQPATAAPAPQPEPAQAPVPQNQAQRDIDYLRREASRNPSRSGPSSDPRAPKGPMTFEQRLRAQMARDGID